MPGYNSNFELTVADIDLIEAALNQTRANLSARLVSDTVAARPDDDSAPDTDTDAMLRHIHDLMGRLHNQKVFYRPRSGPYIGG